MKTKKWLWITLMVLLTLVVLVGVAGAGFRLGMMQNATFVQRQNLRAQNFNQAPNANGKATNPQDQGFGQMPNGKGPHMQGFDPRGDSGRGFDQRFGPNRGFNRGRGGFFPPLFGLFHLLILGVLLWFGYKYIKNSGWKLVREAQPTPVVSEPASIAEKKDEV